MSNIHADIPSSLPNEMFNALISNENIRIERIHVTWTQLPRGRLV